MNADVSGRMRRGWNERGIDLPSSRAVTVDDCGSARCKFFVPSVRACGRDGDPHRARERAEVRIQLPVAHARHDHATGLIGRDEERCRRVCEDLGKRRVKTERKSVGDGAGSAAGGDERLLRPCLGGTAKRLRARSATSATRGSATRRSSALRRHFSRFGSVSVVRDNGSGAVSGRSHSISRNAASRSISCCGSLTSAS